jgi:hypothetical protein
MLLLVGAFILGQKTKSINDAAANGSFQAIVHIAALTQLTPEEQRAKPLIEEMLYENIVAIAKIKRLPKWIQSISIKRSFLKQMDEAVNRYIMWKETTGTNYSLPSQIPLEPGGDRQQIEERNRFLREGNRLIEEMTKSTQQGHGA